MGNTPRVIIHLLIINAIFFFGSKVSGAISNDFLALHYFENDKFIISQLFTHLFMHGNEAHLFFNMFGLWMFGSTLANIWGTNKFLFFYISSGLGAAIVQMIMYYLNIDSVTSTLLEYGVSNEIILNILKTGSANPMIFEYVPQSKLASMVGDYNAVMVGASGAIYGVLVAFTFMFPNSKLMLLFPPIPVKAKYLIPLIILGDFFFGFTSASIGPIAHFAHIGGAFTGFVMMWYWKNNQFNKNRWN